MRVDAHSCSGLVLEGVCFGGGAVGGCAGQGRKRGAHYPRRIDSDGQKGKLLLFNEEKSFFLLVYSEEMKFPRGRQIAEVFRLKRIPRVCLWILLGKVIWWSLKTNLRKRLFFI